MEAGLRTTGCATRHCVAVAVVAGATRGAGRGIAAALGEAGRDGDLHGSQQRVRATMQSDYDRPETIEETAELVTRAGRHRRSRAGRPPRHRRGTRLAERIRRRLRRDRHPRQRHLGCGGAQGRPADVEQADLGTRPRRRSADPAARHRHAPHHVALSAAAAGDAARRPAGRGDRRHHRVTTTPTTGSRCSTTWPRSR